MSKLYFTEWRSKTQCLAMQLGSATELPDEETGTVRNFQQGDYEIHQNGKVFGRGQEVHEAAFEPVRKTKAKAATKARAKAKEKLAVEKAATV